MVKEKMEKVKEEIVETLKTDEKKVKEIVKEKKVKEISEDGETKEVEEVKKTSEEPKEKKKESSEDRRDEKKKERKERVGVLNIYTSFNNTLMNLTDLSGKSFAKYTGGQSTKQCRLKANPTIAMFIAQRIAEEARDNGLTGFYVRIRAKTGQNNPGPGAHAALKSLTRAGFKVLSIMDTTRIARGGPKQKGGRRGRRP